MRSTMGCVLGSLVGADLKSLLAAAPPPNVPLLKLWSPLIQALRAHKRSTGEVPGLASRRAVERALSQVPIDEGVAKRVKPLLRRFHREGHPVAIAVEIDAAICAALPLTVQGEVHVTVEGWPKDFGAELQARLLRRDSSPPYDMPAPEAAAMRREFDGVLLAGSELRVNVALPEGAVLPAVPRSLRARPMPRGRTGPWLPHWDDEGRRFITPEALADRLARQLVDRGVSRLVDGCAGLGGNSIAFARAGISVTAVEASPARLRLAQRNAEDLGCGGRIRWRLGRIEEVLPTLPEVLLFLDPPWDRENAGLPDWLPFPENRALVLKAPAAFDPRKLPARDWKTQFEFGERDDDRATVKMLTLWSF